MNYSKVQKNTGALTVDAAAAKLSRNMSILGNSESMLAPFAIKKRPLRPKPSKPITPETSRPPMETTARMKIPTKGTATAGEKNIAAFKATTAVQKSAATSVQKKMPTQVVQKSAPAPSTKTAPQMKTPQPPAKPATAPTNADPRMSASQPAPVNSRLGASSSFQELTQNVAALNRRMVTLEAANTTIIDRLTTLETLACSMNETLKSMMDNQLSVFNMMKDLTRRNSPKARTRPAVLPFKSTADLLAFDNVTAEVFDDVVNYLAYLGGVNVCDEANVYFKHCFEFDQDLFRNLSWHGSKTEEAKVALKSTRFAEACEAAMNLNRDALEKPTLDKFMIAMTKAIKNAKEGYRRKMPAATRKRQADNLEEQPPQQRIRVLLPKKPANVTIENPQDGIVHQDPPYFERANYDEDLQSTIVPNDQHYAAQEQNNEAEEQDNEAQNGGNYKENEEEHEDDVDNEMDEGEKIEQDEMEQEEKEENYRGAAGGFTE